MAGAVKHARIETRTSRAKIKDAYKLHKQSLVTGRASLCWRWKDNWPTGRWLLIRNIDGKYTREAIGGADDTAEADGERVLTYDQAKAKALTVIDAPKAKRQRITVRQAMDAYIEHKRQQGQPTRDLKSRADCHILPTLGNKVVAELTAERLRRWLSDLATTPAFRRTAKGKPQAYKAEPTTEEAMRKRRASANRVLTMLKAALNHAYDENHVASNAPWGRRLKPFEGADAARLRYLSIAEAKRLISACDGEFRPLVSGALLTGARFGQLIELRVDHFNPDSGTIQLRSRKGRGKHVTAEARMSRNCGPAQHTGCHSP
jgi:hypothetical protein